MMGWGSKAIEIRSVETGQLDGVFMHKKTQKLKFLCGRNDKVTKLGLGLGLGHNALMVVIILKHSLYDCIHRITGIVATKTDLTHYIRVSAVEA